jgi:transcriptional regulator with XRE-family HTH domain
LVEARKSSGLTQTTLARRLARPQSYVSKYERGERRIDFLEFLEISEELGIDPNALMKELKAAKELGS